MCARPISLLDPLAPNTPLTYREAYARGQAQEWLSRRDGRSPWVAVLAILLTLSLAFNLYQYLRQRRTGAQPAQAPAPTEKASSKPPPEEPISDDEDAALFDRRLGYIKRVIFTPGEVASIILDPILAKRLNTNQIKRNAHIFACAAALEEVEDGKTFENRPSNTYRSYMKPWFTKKGWDWPLGVVEWTAFFEGR